MRAFKERGFCPLIKNPVVDCHCLNLSSISIMQMIHYCNKNFKECHIYQKEFASGINESCLTG